MRILICRFCLTIGFLSLWFLWPVNHLCAQTAEKPTCAVLAFNPDEASAKPYESRYITERFCTFLEKLDIYEVLDPVKVDKRLKEKNWQMLNVCRDDKCAMEVGNILDVDYIIYGTIGHIGKLYSLDTSLIDVRNQKVLNSAATDYEGTRDEFAQKIPPENIKALLGIRETPVVWRDLLAETKPAAQQEQESREVSPVFEPQEPEISIKPRLRFGPRIGFGYNKDHLKMGGGIEIRKGKLGFNAMITTVGYAGGIVYYLKESGNTPFAALVGVYYEDDPDGIDEIGRIIGLMGGYQMAVNEHLNLNFGIGAGYVNWDQTEENYPGTGIKDHGDEITFLGEITIGYLF